MQTSIFGAILIVLSLSCLSAAAGHEKTPEWKSFLGFQKKYQRQYASDIETMTRFQNFKDNLRRASELAKRNPYASFGVTQFSDMSAEEFKTRVLGNFSDLADRRAKNPVKPIFSDDEVKARDGAIDWRNYNAVTYVKNQGNCGGCWSFSSTGSIEGQWVIAGGQSLVALSEQNLISCDTLDSGCGGGIMDNAWTWLVQNQGGQIATESSDPFVSASGTAPACSTSGVTWGATITGHSDLPQDEQQMAAWMNNNGPISIAIDATSFQTYNGGIITDCISQQVDHAVLAIGYNDQSNPPYWIIKNSWGPGWGIGGYVYVEMYQNQCLITTAPCTSVVGSGSDWHVKKRPPMVPSRLRVKEHIPK